MLRQYLELPRSVHVLCLGTFVNRAGSFMIIFLTIYLKERLGLGVAFATQTMGAYGAGAIVASVVGGHLADRIGRRTVMLLSLGGGSVVLMAFGSLSSAPAIITAVVVFSLLTEMYRPAASAMIADLVSPAHRVHAYGLMYLSINLGFSVAPVAGGLLAAYSFLVMFWVDAATMLTYGLIIFFAIRETLPSRSASGNASSSISTNRHKSDGDSTEMTILDAAKRIVRDRVFVVFSVATLASGVMYTQAFSTFPLWLDMNGIGADGYGRIIAINGAMIVCLQLPFTSLVNRFSRGAVLMVSAVVMGTGFALIGVVSTVWGFAFTVVVWTIGEMMESPIRMSVAADLAPVDMRARYMGVLSMSFSGALAIGAPVGGMVLTRFGGGALWGGCLALSLVASALCLSIYRPLTRTAERDGTHK